MASLAGAGVLMNAPGRWRTGVGVAMWDAMGCRRRGLQDRISGAPLLKTGTSRSRRRVEVDGRWSVVGGRRQQLRLSHLSVLRRGNRIAPSYRNINGTWPVESRRVEGLEEQEQERKQQEQEQGRCSRRSLG